MWYWLLIFKSLRAVFLFYPTITVILWKLWACSGVPKCHESSRRTHPPCITASRCMFVHYSVRQELDSKTVNPSSHLERHDWRGARGRAGVWFNILDRPISQNMRANVALLNFFQAPDHMYCAECDTSGTMATKQQYKQPRVCFSFPLEMSLHG